MKKRNKHELICGDLCPDCTYIGDGDYLCDCDKFDEAKIVLTDFSFPTSDYMRCKKDNKGEQK